MGSVKAAIMFRRNTQSLGSHPGRSGKANTLRFTLREPKLSAVIDIKAIKLQIRRTGTYFAVSNFQKKPP